MQGSIHYLDKSTNKIIKTVSTDHEEVTVISKKTPKRASVSTRATTRKQGSTRETMDIESSENSMYEIHKTHKIHKKDRFDKEIDKRIEEICKKQTKKDKFDKEIDKRIEEIAKKQQEIITKASRLTTECTVKTTTKSLKI